MTPAECMRVLGLAGAVTVEQIKHAYRQLAQTNHPDKRGGDESALKRFIEISTAYRILIRAARAHEQGNLVGTCHRCRQFGEVLNMPDGHLRCPQCALKKRGSRLLPLPMFVVVKCVGAILLIAAGFYFLMVAWASGKQIHAAGALTCGLLGLISLAHTSIKVVHCLSPHERISQRQQQTVSKRS